MGGLPDRCGISAGLKNLQRSLAPFALDGNIIFCRQLIWGEPSLERWHLPGGYLGERFASSRVWELMED